MKWQEVRDLFPHQFMLVSILHHHEKDNKKIVEEVAPIRSILNEEWDKQFSVFKQSI
jgi:hypothetical protein